MGGCEIVRGEYAYATGLILLYILRRSSARSSSRRSSGSRWDCRLDDPVSLYLGFKLRGLTGMILAVPVGLVFINFYKYGAFDSMIRNFRMLMEAIQKFRREE